MPPERRRPRRGGRAPLAGVLLALLALLSPPAPAGGAAPWAAHALQVPDYSIYKRRCAPSAPNAPHVVHAPAELRARASSGPWRRVGGPARAALVQGAARPPAAGDTRMPRPSPRAPRLTCSAASRLSNAPRSDLLAEVSGMAAANPAKMRSRVERAEDGDYSVEVMVRAWRRIIYNSVLNKSGTRPRVRAAYRPPSKPSLGPARPPAGCARPPPPPPPAAPANTATRPRRRAPRQFVNLEPAGLSEARDDKVRLLMVRR